MLSATMFVCTGVRRASAQDAPPNLRMLLNLDLFESRPSNIESTSAPGVAAHDDSMLDQIRTLDAMGYLGNRPTADSNDAAGKAIGAPAPRNPAFDVEGPQR